MDTRELVAERLEALCKKKNIAPYRLGLRAGVPSSTVRSILSGQSRNPGIVTLAKLCKGLDMTVQDFFDTKDFKKLPKKK